MKNDIGYRTFFRYLEYVWKDGHADYLGGLLGGMSLGQDGSPMDIAYEKDWEKAIDQSTAPNDAYQLGILFLKNWLAIGYEDDIDKVCRDMESEAHLDLWKKAVNDVQENNDDPYLKWENG